MTNAEYSARWRRENPEKAKESDRRNRAKRRAKDIEADRKRERERRRRWRAKNPDKAKTDARESSRRHRAKYPDENRQVVAEWRVKNPEKNAAAIAKWRAENPDKVAAQYALRRAREKNAPVTEVVNRTVVAESNDWICQLCLEPIDPTKTYIDPGTGKPDPEYLNIDHIIPLAKGGDHTYANSQASHARCNNRKRTQMPEDVK